MKKFICIIMVVLIAVSMSACALVGNTNSSESSSEPQVSATPAPEVTEPTPTPAPESTASSEEPAVEEEETESGELPAVKSSSEFVAKFNGNDIDSYYLDEIKKAASVSAMVSVTEKTTRAWETQMNSSFSKLIDACAGDAEAKTLVENQQKAWVSDLNIKLEEIKAEIDMESSMANLEIAYNYMLIYRSRCVEILEGLFEKTGDFEITMTNTDAVG